MGYTRSLKGLMTLAKCFISVKNVLYQPLKSYMKLEMESRFIERRLSGWTDRSNNRATTFTNLKRPLGRLKSVI